MQEIWKDIDGYEGLYQVSNLGKIMSLNYMHTKQSQILKIKKTYDGYNRVNLCKDGKVTTCSVHILVAKAFIPNINNKPQVNHKDGNKDNNRVDNLEWVTGKENVIHSIKTGLRKPENRTYLKGQDHYSSKPVFQYDLSGNLIKEWGCQSDAARFYGFRVGSINNAIHGRIKTYKGFIWRSEPL